MSRKYVRIIEAIPHHNEENVALDQKIELSFTHSMVKDTVVDKSKVMLLKGLEQVPAVYKYYGKTKTLIITPTEKLIPSTTYRVKVLSGEEGPISNSVLEVDGAKKLRSDHNYVFTTVPPKEDTSEPNPDPNPDSETGGTEGDDGGTDNTPANPEDDSGVIYDPLEDKLNNLHITESFPDLGDLVDLDSHMVFNFNKPVNKTTLQENIFVKENRINPLLEKLNKDKLIKGVVEAGNGTEEDKEFTFKPAEVLKPGVEYQVVIKKELHEELNYDIRINFQTLFERMFADVDTVRLVLGAFADRLTDLDLAKLINQQSNSIYQLASMMDSFNQSDWAEENGVIVTFPYAASQYVVYSTAYYAILGRSLEGSSGMSESIKLADLSVAASSESSDNLSDLLELLKAEFERWWNVLQGEPEEIEPGTPNPNYTMTIATRGGDEAPYPDFQTRVPFNELGGRDS